MRNSGYSFKASECVMLESRGVIEGQLVFFTLHPVMHIRPTYILNFDFRLRFSMVLWPLIAIGIGEGIYKSDDFIITDKSPSIGSPFSQA